MFEDDITYCVSSCMNTSCFRHKSQIDWSTAKHRYYGASMADFSNDCPDYIPKDDSVEDDYD